jgi:hypothetical protein
LLIKLTGWTRIGFIKEVFPDAKIVHIIRDPHAVVNSTLNVQWWRGWEGPYKWRWGPLNEEETQIWKKYGESFLVLAAIEWKKIMEAYRRSMDLLPPPARADVMEIHYRDLCSAKNKVMKAVTAFCELEYSAAFEKALTRHPLKSQDHKWAQNFTEKQQEQLNQALKELRWESYVNP